MAWCSPQIHTFIMLLSSYIILAIALDYWLGEPPHHHPLIGFGNTAKWLESVSHNSQQSHAAQVFNGASAVFALLTPVIMLEILLRQIPLLEQILSPLILYFCIGANSLKQHANDVQQALLANNLEQARQAVGLIVSRQTGKMSEQDVRKATIESVLENGADAIFAPLFWFVVAGPTGALLYRLTNTLDAMWGYKNSRYLYFGRIAARLDDCINWFPARLTALSYALMGNTQTALKCWMKQAYLLDSPNAGPVMTAGAGAMNIQLGGPAYYDGKLKPKIHFGSNNPAHNDDITGTILLINKTLALWLIVIITGTFFA
jgi:adenosylcobinamide-phosphate synthase